MKYLLASLVFFLMFTSCITKQRCLRKFPPLQQTETETIKETIYRDTIIYINIPGDTIKPPPIDIITGDQGLETPRSYLQSDFAESFAWVEAGKLMHELHQRPQRLERTIYEAIKVEYSHTLTSTSRIHEVKYIPKIYKWSFWIVIIIIIIILGRIFILPKILPGILKL